MKRILLDANLLVLLVIGLTDRNLVPKHKNAKTFEKADYDLLVDILSSYDAIAVTLHILAETSNLVSQIGEPVSSSVRLTFSNLLQSQEEIYLASRDSAKHPLFVRLGLTDTSILQVIRSDTPLLATDAGLYLEASKVNPVATNFNHLRQARLLGS